MASFGVGDKGHKELTLEEEAALFDFDVCVEHVTGGDRPQQWLIAATVLSCRRFNVSAFIETIIGVWKPIKGASGRSVADNLFVFEFQHERDMNHALQEGPWHFNNQLVVSQRIASEEEARLAELRWCRFWIQVLNVPFYRISTAQAKGLGDQLGRFIECDGETLKGGSADLVRLRIEMDITKPIRRGLWVRAKGEQQWLDIRYEKIPNYCFWCGGFDHVERDCEAALDEGAKEGDIRRFANLKATPIRRTFLRTANEGRWNGKLNQWGPRFVHRREAVVAQGNLVQQCDDVLAADKDVNGCGKKGSTSTSAVAPLLARSLEVLTITGMKRGSQGAGQHDQTSIGSRESDREELSGVEGLRGAGIEVGKLGRGTMGEAATGLPNGEYRDDNSEGRGANTNGSELLEIGEVDGTTDFDVVGQQGKLKENGGAIGIGNIGLGDLPGIAEKGEGQLGIKAVDIGEINGTNGSGDSCASGAMGVSLGTPAGEGIQREELEPNSHALMEQASRGGAGDVGPFTSVRKWKRRARDSRGEDGQLFCTPGKRGNFEDVEMEEATEWKKTRQVDAIILAIITAGPEQQVRRLQ